MNMNLKSLLVPAAVALAAIPVTPLRAQTVLFKSDTARHVIYRIPALVAYGNTLLYFGDDRSGVTDATAWGDVGSEGNISIVARRSDNCGDTWHPEVQTVVEGKGSRGFDRAHGDAAVVCDRKSGKLLLLCASGEISYGRSDVKVARTPRDGGGYDYRLDLTKAQHAGRYYSTDGGRTWTGEDISGQIYALYDEASADTYAEGKGNVAVERLFFASGRICQSRQIKRGSHYRIYSVLTTNQGSLVVYSDDFGQRWKPLGGASARPAPQGDEAKIEELPDGRVLLSCRMMGGRCFNIFTYSNKSCTEGTWATPVASTSLSGGTASQRNATNGEIMIVPAKSAAGKKVFVALQSVPYGNNWSSTINVDRRSHVSIYWKVLASAADYATPEQFLTGWTRYEVTTARSAYSTMAIDGRGRLAFAYEDNGASKVIGSQPADVYDLTFISLPLEKITGGQYTYRKR